MGKSDLRVAVIFEAGKITPVWIDRRGTKIAITQISYYWESHIGRELIRHYSVTDGRSNYELMFNSETLQWTFGYLRSDDE